MEILILASLILLNGLFAMSEVALLTSRKPRLEARVKQGDALAAAALRLAHDPTRFLSTIQIGMTSIGILNGIVGEAFLSAKVSAWLQATLLIAPKTANVVATAGIVVVITYVSIVVGELVPKSIALQDPTRTAAPAQDTVAPDAAPAATVAPPVTLATPHN